MNYAAKITELGRRTDEISDKIDSLNERRKEFALGAVEGDKTNLKAIQVIDDEAEALRREYETLTAAIDQADRLRLEQEAEIARKDRERREVEARKIADAALATTADIDGTMARLRELFERRAKYIHQLAGTGTVEPTLILRMLQKFGPTCAARAAGLHQFISIEHVSPEQVRSLIESSTVLKGRLSATGVDSSDQSHAA